MKTVKHIISLIWSLVIDIVYLFFAYLFVFKNIDYTVYLKVALVLGFISAIKKMYYSLFRNANARNYVISILKSTPSFLYIVTFLFTLISRSFL